LHELQLLYSDLNSLIIEYARNAAWEITASASWRQKGSPHGLVNSQEHLHLCIPFSNLVVTSSPTGEIIKENPSLICPTGIDMDEKKFQFIHC